jgi:hypothetical protein
VNEEEKFECKDEHEIWLRNRGVHADDAGPVASKLFANDFNNSLRLLGISSDDLQKVGLGIPLARELSNRLMIQQQQSIPAQTLAALGAMAKEYLEKKDTIVLSHATSSAKVDLMEMLELAEEGASWPVLPTIIPSFPPFQWMQSGEDVLENWVAYMAHLADNVPLPSQYAFADLQQHRSSLSVDLPGKEKRRKISGTSDVVVAEVRNIQNDALRNNMLALLKLKTSDNMEKKNHNAQVVCEHIAASCFK